MSRINQADYFMGIAELVSKRATCPRRQVGCVIVNSHNHIIATGYNGVPSKMAHCTDTPCGGQNHKSGEGLDSCMATHAEQNALLQCPDIHQIDTIYVTTAPCNTCAKLIANTSCKTLIYKSGYLNDGLDLLRSLGIRVCQS